MFLLFSAIAPCGLLKQIALLRKASYSWDYIRAVLPETSPAPISQMRAARLGVAAAERLANEALSVATTTLDEPHGRWVLDNHAGGESETSWTGILGNEIHTVKPDRVFCAGDAPGTDGTDYWIVDYKTAIVADMTDPARHAKQRAIFAPQLTVYARMLRQLHGGAIKVHAGLYYPRMKMLDTWAVDAF